MPSDSRASWRPLVAIALTMTMVYITSFGINVLIGAIVADLETTVANLQLVIVLASVVGGSLMVTAGRLADKLGKKKVLLAGIVLYMAGLTTVVLSPNATVFTIAWSLIWPAGMVLILPTTISMIMFYYEGGQRAAAFGAYGAVLSAVSAIAPVLIGFLTTEFNWRIALALSPAVGVVALLVSLSLEETERDSSIQIDLPSVLLSLAGFGLFLVTTTMAGQFGWFAEKRPFMIGEMQLSLMGLSVVPLFYALSAGLLIAFVQRGRALSRKGLDPLLDVSILKNTPFTIGMTLTALFFLVNAGIIFVVSVFLQAGAKFDSLDTALTTLPYTACVAVLSFFTPNLGKRVPPKWIIVAGLLLMITGTHVIGLEAGVDIAPSDLLVGMLLLGAGAGLVMAQASTVTMWTVPAEDSGAASGLSETLKEIMGQGFAVALAGSILFGAVYGNMTERYETIEGLELSEPERASLIIELEDTFQTISESKEREFVATLPEKSRQEYDAIVADSATKAFSTALAAMNGFAVVAALLALAIPGRRIED